MLVIDSPMSAAKSLQFSVQAGRTGAGSFLQGEE